MASAQGAANESMQKVRHTQTAATQINKKMVDLSRFFLELKSYQRSLDRLAKYTMTEAGMRAFLSNSIFCIDSREKAGKTRGEEKINAIVAQHNTDQGMTPGTGWALLNAVSFVVDHSAPRKGSDTASLYWDGLVGERAKFKDQVYQALVKLAA
jgi:hypothetical protein